MVSTSAKVNGRENSPTTGQEGVSSGGSDYVYLLGTRLGSVGSPD